MGILEYIDTLTEAAIGGWIAPAAANHIVFHRLPLAVSNWPQEARDLFEERVAIMCTDGAVLQEEAERKAEIDIRRVLSCVTPAARAVSRNSGT